MVSSSEEYSDGDDEENSNLLYINIYDIKKIKIKFILLFNF